MATLETVRKDALALSTKEREILAVELATSLEPEPGYDQAWALEIKRRLDKLDAGEGNLMDWDEAEKFIFGEPD